jgi:hypothetical protein
VDEAALLAEAEELMRADSEANAQWLEVVAGERGVFSELVEGALLRRGDVERHALLK